MIEQSTASLFGMCMAVLALVGLLAYLADDNIRLRANETMTFEADHEECIERILDVMHDKAVADSLRALADEYETPAGRARLAEVKRDWTPEGPIMPVLWIRHYADELDPEENR